MSVAPDLSKSTAAGRAAHAGDHHVADYDLDPYSHTGAGASYAQDLGRDFACLVSVTHLSGSDARRLRLVDGVTGVIDTGSTADAYMIVLADSPRAAQRACVERVSEKLPQSVVTVPEVVDYNHALVSFLESHGEHPDDADQLATFDDAQVVAEVLDRA